jgi:hypothetical protein
MNRPEVSVAVDGSLYRFHPHFHAINAPHTTTENILIATLGLLVWKQVWLQNSPN